VGGHLANNEAQNKLHAEASINPADELDALRQQAEQLNQQVRAILHAISRQTSVTLPKWIAWRRI
jgi:hypothetical protein